MRPVDQPPGSQPRGGTTRTLIERVFLAGGVVTLALGGVLLAAEVLLGFPPVLFGFLLGGILGVGLGAFFALVGWQARAHRIALLAQAVSPDEWRRLHR